MFITITLFVKFLGSRRGHFGNGHLPGYGGRFPEVPTADHGESRESHQTGGETGQGGVSGGAGNRCVLGGGGSKNSITRYHIQCLREYITVFIHASSFCCVYALFKDEVHLRYIMVRTMTKLLMKVEVTCNCISCYNCTVQ